MSVQTSDPTVESALLGHAGPRAHAIGTGPEPLLTELRRHAHDGPQLPDAGVPELDFDSAIPAGLPAS